MLPIFLPLLIIIFTAVYFATSLSAQYMPSTRTFAAVPTYTGDHAAIDTFFWASINFMKFMWAL